MGEWHVRNIANDIQVIHQLHLSDEAWQRIREGLNGAVKAETEDLLFLKDLHERRYKEIKEIDYEKIFHELKQYLKREALKQPNFTHAFTFILFIMKELYDGKSVR